MEIIGVPDQKLIEVSFYISQNREPQGKNISLVLTPLIHLCHMRIKEENSEHLLQKI